MGDREVVIKKLRMNTIESPGTESWDLFYTLTGCNVFSHLYGADWWPQLQTLLTSHLLSVPSSSSSSSSPPPESAGAPPSVSILVPGCGNSMLSEHLYDAGFTNITNVDFSKVVISHMLERNVRVRPLMKWRAMDMTAMKFANETFDAIIDIRGLDVLMESELGLNSGNLYVSEVKRLLKPGGRYICVTLAESKVLGILLPRFRYGWKMNLYAIAPGSSSGDLNQQSFMTVAKKLAATVASQISLTLDDYSVEAHGSQAHKFHEALEREKKFRTVFSYAFDTFLLLEDLKENFEELEPGRRVKFTLGQPGGSRVLYNCIILDAQRDFGPFSIQFLVFIVPNSRNFEWITSSPKQQWLIVEDFKTARLLMVVLDSKHANFSIDDIQKDLTPLVKKLAPGNCDEVQISFATASDGVKEEETVHQVTSALSGLIVVDDLIYGKASNHRIPGKDLILRRLTVEGMVRSKALLTREGPIGISSEVEKKKVQATSRTRKKGKNKKFHSHSSGSHGDGESSSGSLIKSFSRPSGVLKVHHGHLLSTHHNAIIAGLLLISLHLKRSTSAPGLVKTMFIGLIPISQIRTVVIGLGAGPLAMFMKNFLPYLKIEVVEVDPVILDVAREYFDFIEDKRLKVHITDGAQFVSEKADCDADGSKIDILILDVHSPKKGSILTSPPAELVKGSFLLTIKKSLSEEGLLIIHLVTMSSTVKLTLYLRLKAVFSNIFCLPLEEDVNEVIFALNTDDPINEDHLSEACNVLATSFEFEKHEWGQRIIDASKFIKPLRRL